ncbi:MAG TPA: GNAT family N-acetyltransferase [Myxococcales bacterium]|nr:GNAT family N-acetyltransferase [Myxococcales bacterium]
MLRELADPEREAYFRGVQPIWGGGLNPERFVAFQRRLADSPEAGQRYRLLGLFDGDRLLSAMKAYDLQGTCAGSPLRLLGIGAVFTPPALRRRGHARRMLELAMADHREHGFDAALLFSDIGGAYYERLGFQAVQSDECTAEAADLPRTSARAAIVGDESSVARVFAQSRTADGELSLARDGWVLSFQLRRLRELARARGAGEPEWALRITSTSGEAAAMLRVSRDAVDVLDAGWTDESLREPLLAALRDFLLRNGRSRLRLWPAHQLRGLFPAEARASALAMVAPLRANVKLPAAGAPVAFALLDHI